MAGVTLENYKGNDAGEQNVAAIGGAQYRSSIGLPADTTVAKSAHLTDGPRAEGVAYDTNNSIGVNLDTSGYPAGTDFGESSNPLR